MVKRGKRLEAALRIRDAAISKIQSEGRWEQTGRVGPTMMWDGEGLKIGYRTPFQKLPPVTDPLLKQRLVAAGKMNLPYGLDIWDMEGVGKVLNIEWSETGDIHLVSFRRGAWEEKVLT